MGQEAFGVPALITVTLGTFVMLRYFAAAETSWAVRLQVMLSWTLSLSIIALVPADVAATMRGEPLPILGGAVQVVCVELQKLSAIQHRDKKLNPADP
jgi:hypothetical protein